MWFVLCMWQCPTNFTDYNGAQTWTIILWWTGWCNTLSSNNGVVRWGISACITPLCHWGGLVPSSLHCRLCLLPANMAGVHQEGPGISTERCGKGAGGQVEHLVVWEKEWVMRSRELTTHPKQPTSFLFAVINCPLGTLLQHQLQSTVVGRILQSNQQIILNLHLVAPTIWRWTT